MSQKYIKTNYSKSVYTEESTIFWTKLTQKNVKVLKLFFKNLTYILKRKNLTVYGMVKDLKLDGITVNRCSTTNYRNGKNVNCALSYLHIYCVYLDVELVDMISCDLEVRDKMRGLPDVKEMRGKRLKKNIIPLPYKI